MAASRVAQYGKDPFSFINGFGMQNDPHALDTVLDIFYGRILDSTYSYQLTMQPGILFIDLNIIGAGGLDKAPLSANKVYGVYVIWDPVGNNQPTAMLPSSYYHPLIPSGYSAVKLVGYAATDASSNFRQSSWNLYGNSGYRNMMYMPSVTALEGGNSNIQTNVSLISYIPNIDGQIANLKLSFTSSMPGNCLTIYSNMGNFNLYAQADGIANTLLTNLIVTNQVILDGVVTPVIGYSVTNSETDSASIYCNGYDFFI